MKCEAPEEQKESGSISQPLRLGLRAEGSQFQPMTLADHSLGAKSRTKGGSETPELGAVASRAQPLRVAFRWPRRILLAESDAQSGLTRGLQETEATKGLIPAAGLMASVGMFLPQVSLPRGGRQP